MILPCIHLFFCRFENPLIYVLVFFLFFLLRRHIISRVLFSLAFFGDRTTHKTFCLVCPRARGHPDEMGFDDKKRKSNPSERRVQKRDFKRSNRSNTWDKEPKGKRPRRGGGPHHDRKKNGEGKYGATEYVRENEHFEKYYKAQKICASDEEFEQLMRVLKTDLPSSFRINGVGNFARCVHLAAPKVFRVFASFFASESVEKSTARVSPPHRERDERSRLIEDVAFVAYSPPLILLPAAAAASVCGSIATATITPTVESSNE